MNHTYRKLLIKFMSIIKECKLVRISENNRSKYHILLEIEGEQYKCKTVPVEKEIANSYDSSHWKYLFSYVDVEVNDYLNDDLNSVKYLHLICQNTNLENPFLYVKHYRYDKDMENFIYEWFEKFDCKVDNNSKFIEGKTEKKEINGHHFEITYYFKFQNEYKIETYKVRRALNKETVEKDIFEL